MNNSGSFYRNKHSDKVDKSSDDEIELFSKTRANPKDELAAVEKSIEDGDTLQSLAIRYRCTIADIKRLNNIHNENEIYARNSIRVPHRPFTEALAQVHVSGSATPEDKLIDIQDGTKIKEMSEINQIIFNSQVVHKISEIVPEAEDQTVEDDEEVQLLPTKKREESYLLTLSCSGVDGDISLHGLLICIIVMIFAVPIIFYLTEHPKKIHHDQT